MKLLGRNSELLAYLNCQRIEVTDFSVSFILNTQPSYKFFKSPVVISDFLTLNDGRWKDVFLQMVEQLKEMTDKNYYIVDAWNHNYWRYDQTKNKLMFVALHKIIEDLENVFSNSAFSFVKIGEPNTIYYAGQKESILSSVLLMWLNCYVGGQDRKYKHLFHYDVTLKPPAFDLRKHFKVLRIKCNEANVINKIESIFGQLAVDDFESTYDKVKFWLQELFEL